MNDRDPAAPRSEAPGPPASADTSAAALLELHAEIDRRAAEVAAVHADRLNCGRGCAACCVDDVTVFVVEAERIRAALAAAPLPADATPHPAGACAFLDSERACRIYADRPYVCRTQGLPLRWVEQEDEDSAVEFRDICPENDSPSDPPLETLDAEVLWTLGPFESALAQLEQQRSGGQPERVPLRALFPTA